MMSEYLPASVKDRMSVYPGYHFEVLTPFTEYHIDGMQVVPIPADHPGTVEGEQGLNYLIRDREEKRFLYACDTGWYADDVWDYLYKKQPALDYLIIECTFGTYRTCAEGEHPYGHQDYPTLLAMLEKFEQCGCITRETPIYTTHICHLSTDGYEEMQDYFDSLNWNICSAYDGMGL